MPEQVAIDRLICEHHPNAQLVAPGQVDLDAIRVLNPRHEAGVGPEVSSEILEVREQEPVAGGMLKAQPGQIACGC